VDFPHLMLRGKAQKFKQQGASFRDKSISGTDTLAKLITIPVIEEAANALNKNKTFRKVFEASFGIHRDAVLPEYNRKSLRKLWQESDQLAAPTASGGTTGKVAFYATCYGNYNSPNLGEDFREVYRHNDIIVDLVEKEACCGMPKMELGDLDAVEKLKEKNIPVLAKMVDGGYDLIAPIPSCVLMYKQELPLMFPDDPEVKKVQEAFYDPFEYLYLRHKSGLLKTDFKNSLGDISYQVACHLRVQKIGLKTRDILALVPDTNVNAIERCSGHDGTYAMKKETYDTSVKIARPVIRKMEQQSADYFSSDCPMAAEHLVGLSKTSDQATHPMTLLRKAYGI
jgi:Fe-S oxidoreductase